MNIHILTVPYDSGMYGVRMGAGPERLLACGLRERLVTSGHDVSVGEILAASAEVPSEVDTAASVLTGLSNGVSSAVGDNRFPIVLAGSCYSAVGTVAGLSPPHPGVVWFDSHGDLNTPETTESGFMDGMAVSMLTGRCWRTILAKIPDFHPIPDEELLMLGIRDLDSPEIDVIERSNISVLSPERVRGDIVEVASLAKSMERVYVHLDLDVLDPTEGRANALAAPNGLHADELYGVLQALRAQVEIAAIALTAYDPRCDPEGKVANVAIKAVEVVVG